MFLAKDWEIFYTDAEQEDLVDQISIDTANKRYILELNANDLIVDGYDETGEEINSHYVSRFVFDLIVKGVKDEGFSKYNLKKIKKH